MAISFRAGQKGPVVNVPQASGGSANDFYVGDFVKTDSNGQLVIATAGVRLGIALRTAPGGSVANPNIDVELINPQSVYSIPYAATATLATMIGGTGDITYTPNGHYITVGGTTDCVIIGFDDPVGTTSGRCLVRFLQAKAR